MNMVPVVVERRYIRKLHMFKITKRKIASLNTRTGQKSKKGQETRTFEPVVVDTDASAFHISGRFNDGLSRAEHECGDLAAISCPVLLANKAEVAVAAVSNEDAVFLRRDVASLR